MILQKHIDRIRENLEKGIFKSESAVRQGIVNPLLRSLEWPTENTELVYPEYPVGSGKVDYALCSPSSEPRVFIEAKQVGNIDGAEEQLFTYDSRIRVPIAVLTDGRIWRFFHPTGEGTWQERKILDIDLITGNSQDITDYFNRYLNYEAIRSGSALDAIKDDYDNLVKQRKIEKGLPNAWKSLLNDEDENLLQIVADKTKELCGHQPTSDQVIAYLKREEIPTIEIEERPKLIPPIDKNVGTRQPPTRLSVTMHNGEIIEEPNAIDTFIKVLEEFGIEKVMKVHPTTISINKPKYFWREYGDLYIYYYADTNSKKRVLEEIAQSLEFKISVEIITK